MELDGLLLDPAPGEPSPGTRDLFPPSGEFRRAMERLRLAGVLERLPAETALHIYAYEVLERLREEEARAASTGRKGGEETTLLRVPFWPSALFEAARIRSHAAFEIQSLFPRFRRRILRPRPVETLREKAGEIFGALEWDPDLYAGSLRSMAEEEGWTVEEGGEEEERKRSPKR